MEELIKAYLKEHLKIEVNEEYYGYKGKYLTVNLKIDNETISSDSYTLSTDNGDW